MKDLVVDRARNPAAAAADRWDPGAEEDEDADNDLEMNIIDRSESLARFSGLELTYTR